MKTVSTLFTDAQAAPTAKLVRILQYKRRYWQQSTGTYVWESSWTVLPENYDVSVSPVSWQLDTTTVNQYKVSNVSVTLKNFTNEWKADNPYGRFAGDTVSPFGYEPALSKFQVLSGYIKADGTTETVPIFTGVAIDYNANAQAGQMQITLAGEEQLLIGGDAEAVSTTSTYETIGTGDGTTTVFSTANTGVGIVKEVSIAGITKRQGTDYTISVLNDPSNVAKITFLVAPVASATIRATYVYWLQGQKFETLVTNLLNQAGIPALNQSVSPVTFPSNIINSHAWQTQADWNGGVTLTAIDTASIPNSIEYLYGQAQTWNNATTGWSTGTYNNGGTFGNDSTGNYLMQSGTGGGGVYAYRSFTNKYGDWTIQFQFPTDPGVGGIVTLNVALYANAVGTPSNSLKSPFQSAYVLQLQAYHSNSSDFILLETTDATGSYQNALGSANQTISYGTTHTVRVRQRPGFVFSVYFDSVLKFSFTDTSFMPSTANYFGFDTGTGAIPANSKVYMVTNGISVPPTATGLASWQSNSVDFGSTPASWSQFLDAQTLNGGATTYYTRSSADNSTWDAWLAVPNSGVVASTLRRYIQARVDIDITNGDPAVSSITVGGITSSTVITLANFTAMTCFDAITALAKFANYEFGFTSAEVFFFRPRSSNKTPVMTLIKKNQILAVLSQVVGNDRVYSNVRATYGGYITEVYDDKLTMQGPRNRFLLNRLSIDGGTILISKDADVATGIAGSFYGYYRLPRRRVKLSTKILPQIELSDVLSITFDDNIPQGWYVGDMSQTLSAAPSALNLYGAGEQSVSSLIAKVVGVRMDTVNWTAEIDVEEVI